nr:hypothetical protein [Novosphingobium sp. KA1]BAF03273.1 hypothetical protein [Novosphingobium sp. KA1]
MGGRTHPCQGARSRVEHPRRNLEPPVRSRSRLATAQINRTGSFDLLMDVDMPASPGMPAIENFSNFGPVGVASPCCTTTSARTAVLAIGHRHQKRRHRHIRPPVPLRSTSVRIWRR